MAIFRSRRPKVDRLRRKGDIAGLRRALHYRDPVRLSDGGVEDLGVAIRRQSMSALREHGGDDAIAAAVEALGDDDAEVRLEAINTLRDGGRPEPVIEYLLRHPDGDARDQVDATLIAMDDPRAGPVLAQQLLEAEHAGDGQQYAALLGQLLSTASDAEQRELARATARELASEDQTRRARAVVMLSGVREAAVTVLLEALDQPHRARVVEALGRLRDSRALQGLTGLLEDREPDVRAAAARALGEIRDPRAVEGLLKASTDSEFTVREAAIASLDQLGTAGIVFGFAAFVRPVLESSGATRSVEPARAISQAAALEAAAGPMRTMESTPTPAKSPAEAAHTGPPGRRRTGRLARAALRARAAWRDSR